ncbi:hypothetical protein ILUMI_21342 [Ignelater luminosus]|uniref:Uncharacterized protein n=1 Tax=Ignelater luminosus TaxID=2038154 RepID=A0A8K0G3Z1_IGNLU|nr:hypothetical protein ILUMI_21342 [Ignelater luminosus]
MVLENQVAWLVRKCVQRLMDSTRLLDTPRTLLCLSIGEEDGKFACVEMKKSACFSFCSQNKNFEKYARSVDSALGPPRAVSGSLTGPRNVDSTASTRRWVAVEEPVRQTSSGTTRLSPATEPDMAATRGPNVSILHLRSTSEPWETSPTSAFPSGSAVRPYSSGRTTGAGIPQLTKHQSLGGQGYKWDNTAGFHLEGPVNSGDLFVTGPCSRELSPVRWCDREVDGVYLGRSGWVQVQQRSLDENRRISYGNHMSGSLELSRRTGIKLANYHCMSEPGKKPDVTPIISPPPAFQDRKANNTTKARSFFGKAPFLPRSNAIVDSDIISPPPSPPLEKAPPNKNSTLPQMSQSRKMKLTPSPVSRPSLIYPRIPQAKSLEDTTNRRTQFIQRHGESSSSSSSSMGFRSLDSCVNRPAMPKLSENTDSSIDVYEDADEEDNNSSSLNVSVISSLIANPPAELTRPREKISPSGRARLAYHRPQTRRSPAGSDTNKQANSRSSSSSSNDGFPSRSPSGSNQQLRRSAPVRQHYVVKPPQEDAASQKVRRSRSLQLPEKKPPVGFRDQPVQTRISPQHPESHRVVVKIGNTSERPKRHIGQPTKIQSLESNVINEDMIREAEIVTEFLYGTRSRAAAQALLMHRYNNSRDEKPKESLKSSSTNSFDVFYVTKDKQKLLQRGTTTPNSASTKQPFRSSPTTETVNPCNSNTCDFWPHCAHRDTLNSRAQSMMRLSQSYPTHQRSLEASNPENNRSALAVLERTNQEQHRKRSPTSRGMSEVGNPLHVQRRRNDLFTSSRGDVRERRLSPNKATDLKRDMSVDRKISPVNSKSASRSPSAMGNSSNSSSSSDVWVTTSERTASKSPKNAKSSGTSTPLDEVPVVKDDRLREIILTRPGSAPMEDSTVSVESQQRSMSLPKSFLSANYQQG